MLSVLDRKWREHLYEMDYLQEGIGLRAMAQRDPLVEYQREGFLLFNAMNEAIKEESVGYLFNLEVQVEAEEPRPSRPRPRRRPHIVAKGLEAPQRPAHLQYSAPSVDGEGGVEVRDSDARGRPRRRRRVPRDAEERPVPVRLRQEVQALPRRRPGLSLALPV